MYYSRSPTIESLLTRGDERFDDNLLFIKATKLRLSSNLQISHPVIVPSNQAYCSSCYSRYYDILIWAIVVPIIVDYCRLGY